MLFISFFVKESGFLGDCEEQLPANTSTDCRSTDDQQATDRWLTGYQLVIYPRSNIQNKTFIALYVSFKCWTNSDKLNHLWWVDITIKWHHFCCDLSNKGAFQIKFCIHCRTFICCWMAGCCQEVIFVSEGWTM